MDETEKNTAPERKLAAILFSDIVGYTALMGKDENKAMEYMRLSREVQKRLVKHHKGIWLKEMGDGAMMSFSSASDAVYCALDIQNALTDHEELRLRIGIHLGEIIIEEGDIYGDGVNIASRLQTIADPGGIYISDAVQKAIRGRSDIQAQFLGEMDLKNVDYPIKTYALKSGDLPIPEPTSEKELSGRGWAEIKRRNVHRVALVYVIFAAAVISLLPWFASAQTFSVPVYFILGIGFPMALFLAWKYERSPEGFIPVSSEKSWNNPFSDAQKKPLTGNIAIIALLTIVILLNVLPRSTISEPVIPEVDKSIAVLPFENMSNDPDQEYFSDGITEELINALVKVQGLKVVGRTSSFAYKGKNEDLRKIGEELGVSTLLEGSVRKAGDRVRVTAQLVNVSDGFHLWSETYNRELNDIFAVQDEITGSIMDALVIRLGDAPEPKTIKSTDVSVYEIYLKARQKLAARGEDLFEARTLFEEVIRMDSTYSPAYSGLSRTLSLIPDWLGLPSSEVTGLIEAYAFRALELDPNNAEALSALGHSKVYLEWKWKEGEKYLMRSIELEPKDPEVVNFVGDYYTATADPRSIETELLALELDPLHPVKYIDVGVAYRNDSNWEKMIEYLDKMKTIDPNMIIGNINAVIAFEKLGQWTKMEELIESTQPGTSNEKLGHMELKAFMALAKGQKEKAMQLVDVLKEKADEGQYNQGSVANLLLVAGDLDGAAIWLEKAYNARDPWFVRGSIKFLEEYDLLDHPAFREVLSKPEIKELIEIRKRNRQLGDM